MHGDYDEPTLGRLTQPALAPRLSRLGAALIDWALLTTLWMFAAFGSVGWVIEALVKGAPSNLDSIGGASASSRWLTLGSLAAGTLLALYQWYGLATRGQTLGKRLLQVQVVDECGAPAGFLRAVVMRSWVFGLIVGLVQVPLGALGAILPLVDLLPIFGARRRCLHDLLAGTWVRQAAGSRIGALPALALFGASAAGLGALAVTTGAQPQWDQARQLMLTAAQRPPGGGRVDLKDALLELPLKAQRDLPLPSSVTDRPIEYAAPKSTKTIYRYEDDTGEVSFTDDLASVPERFRKRARPID